jgi:glyoxylase-like metal-dependent hydrolase (beta-lactamase superfamily II)
MPLKLLIRQFELGQLANFNYFVGDAGTREVAVIDPGDDTDFLLKNAKKESLKIVAVLLTHGHFDHVGGVIELCAEFKIPAYLSEHEAPFYTPDCPKLLRTKDGEKISIGGIEVACLHTPGHTSGCQCFLVDGNLFTGDTLFVDAVGRTDFPGGNAETLFGSLQKIKQLPDDTIVWPGHNYGSVTQAPLGQLKAQNPFLACKSLEEFLNLAG